LQELVLAWENDMSKTVAVILAAGLGTRMKSARHKALHAIAGRPMLAWCIRSVLKAGCDRVVVVVGHQAENVEAMVGTQFSGADIVFARQDRQLGTGHAALCAESQAAGAKRVLLINGDLPLLRPETLRRLLDTVTDCTTFTVTGAVLDDPTGFGRLIRSTDGSLIEIVEDKDGTAAQRAIHEVNVGLYAATGSTLFATLHRVGTDNAKGEYYFTDVVKLLRADGSRVGIFSLMDADEALQVNDRAGLARVEAILHARKAAALMAGGVTMHLPDSIMIDDDCMVGPDTEVWPGVVMRHGTRVGKDCDIGLGAVLSGVTISDGVTVKPYCVLTDATIADGCQVGPFSHLRPNSVLSAGCHVGNFVELKKTSMGNGSKANHLSYLGDCTIGQRVNVGAGTITCNYDGISKLPTEIADGAFIGSDTQLVAPVRVGKYAYVAAGTTVTRDVPDGALALSRVAQTHVEGYTERRRAKAKSKKEG